MNKSLAIGLHENITPAIYRADPAISRGDIMDTLKAMAYWKWRRDCGEDEATKAKDFGTAFHTMMLEPELFDSRHVVSHFDSFRTNEAKKWRDDTIASGKTIITNDERDSLLGMQMSARQHPRYAEIMKNARREITAVSKHEGTGQLLKARFDILPAGNALVDFKSTVDASPEGFGRQVWNLGYGHQAAHYSDVYNAVSERKKDLFAYFAVENIPPYLCQLYIVPEMLVNYCRKINNAQLYKIDHARKSGVYPGYEARDGEFILPGWAERTLMDAERAIA